MHADTGADTAALDAKIARLERRLERERRARREAEEIADRGMRDLWLANRDLDQRVAERTADLEKTLQELAVASSGRARFLSTLSHETRTPLNGILGMLELLTPHVDGPESSYLETAQQSADRLSQLLTRLLDLVELGTGEVSADLESVQVGDLASAVRDRWQLAAMRTGHLLTVNAADESFIACLDVRRVNQIVDELLDNAVTHGDRGTVSVDVATGSGLMTLAVTDAGPGIDPARIDGLFADFTMIDDGTARAQQGLGLGLGLCRQLAQALHGSLTVANDGRGHTVATLTLPVGSDWGSGDGPGV